MMVECLALDNYVSSLSWEIIREESAEGMYEPEDRKQG